MSKPPKVPPAYVVASVDNALRIATMLQLEGALTVTQVAERLNVAPSTVHRLLATLVYRDFAVQGADRAYRAGPVLELAAHSQSRASQLRTAALPHLRSLVDLVDESANLIVRTGETVRFIATVESSHGLRVSSREGMVFPAHRTTAGLLLLSALSPDEVEALYAEELFAGRLLERPDMAALRADLANARRNGFVLNQDRSERGVVAVGVPVHATGDAPEAVRTPVAAISVSMRSDRHSKEHLPMLVGTLRATAAAVERDLAAATTAEDHTDRQNS